MFPACQALHGPDLPPSPISRGRTWLSSQEHCGPWAPACSDAGLSLTHLSPPPSGPTATGLRQQAGPPERFLCGLPTAGVVYLCDGAGTGVRTGTVTTRSRPAGHSGGTAGGTAPREQRQVSGHSEGQHREPGTGHLLLLPPVPEAQGKREGDTDKRGQAVSVAPTGGRLAPESGSRGPGGGAGRAEAGPWLRQERLRGAERSTASRRDQAHAGAASCEQHRQETAQR